MQGREINHRDAQVIEERNLSTGNVVKRYAKGRLLGKGGFAKCYEFESLDSKKKYAAKVIEKASLTRSKAKEKLHSEIKIHKALRSPYVVGFQHYFEDSQNVYILLELCPNQVLRSLKQTLNELVKRRKRLTEVQAKYYTHQIICALKDIHQQKVIHRDLKLGNLFLTEKLEIRIGDFGLAAELNYEGQKRKTMCGTPNYIAPQILQNNGGHSYEVDIWSLGVIMFAFVTGRPPFETNQVKATYGKIKSCNYSFPQTVPLSRTTKNFIAKMLQREPARRSTLDQLLNDQFFTATPFPKSLPLSSLACPPSSQFLKQYKARESVLEDRQSRSKSISNEQEGLQTNRRGVSLNRKDKELISTGQGQFNGKALTRANSIDRMEVRQHPAVQRAASTVALLAGRRLVRPESKANQQALNRGAHVWVIYSEQNPKFGVCYLLNSNATGMRFNDSTCMISNHNFTIIRYIDQTCIDRNKDMEVYEIGEVPEKLAKKMKIVAHYHRQLMNKKQQEDLRMTNEERIAREKLRYRQTQQTQFRTFIIKHYKTNKSNIFFYNNKDYQVVFKDLTELIVSQNGNITYVNKTNQRKYFHKNELESQSEEVKKRMSYVISAIDRVSTGTNKNRAQEDTENQNPTNILIRSSSVSKVQKTVKISRQAMMKGSASTTRLIGFRRNQ